MLNLVLLVCDSSVFGLAVHKGVECLHKHVYISIRYCILFIQVFHITSIHTKCKQLPSLSLTLGSHLSFPFEPINKYNRPLVLLPPPSHIVNQTHNPNASKHNNSPIELFNVRRRALWPEAPKESMERVQDAADVDGDAPFTEGPGAGGQQFGVCDTAVEDGADGEDVGYH
jgi:hypothetical protein